MPKAEKTTRHSTMNTDPKIAYYSHITYFTRTIVLATLGCYRRLHISGMFAIFVFDSRMMSSCPPRNSDRRHPKGCLCYYTVLTPYFYKYIFAAHLDENAYEPDSTISVSECQSLNLFKNMKFSLNPKRKTPFPPLIDSS